MRTANQCYYRLDVEVSPRRIGQVQRILAAHLRHWGLGELSDSVCRGVGALLESSSEYEADRNTTVEMRWAGQSVVAAVSDKNPAMPGGPAAPGGCIATIAALSHAWGSAPTADGKIIWFSLRTRTDDRARLAPAAPEPALRSARPLARTVPNLVLTGAEPVPAGATASTRTAEARPAPA